jgi:hypothetical protein
MEDAGCTAMPVPDRALPKGLARSRRARWKHGLYSAEALAEQKRARVLALSVHFQHFKAVAGQYGKVFKHDGRSLIVSSKTTT